MRSVFLRHFFLNCISSATTWPNEKKTERTESHAEKPERNLFHFCKEFLDDFEAVKCDERI